MANVKVSIAPLKKELSYLEDSVQNGTDERRSLGIVSGTEVAPDEGNAEAFAKYISRKDSALAIIVLGVDPTLLYLLGDPEDPTEVWKRLQDQFQRKTWSNKLQLRRRLFSLKLRDGEPVHEHIKTMTELFEELAVIGDPVTEEDRVVHLLAGLPASYNVLVTALEAQSENVPKWELITERLLHEERKLKEKLPASDGRRALAANGQSRGRKPPLTCHFCKKPGHFKRDCRKFLATQEAQTKQGESASTAKTDEVSSPESDSEALVTTHALSAASRGNWIVDSGATCHMCNDRELFSEIKFLETPQEVTLGDGHPLQAKAEGTVILETLLPDGSTNKCNLNDVLFVPNLSYSLLSVSKASHAGKTSSGKLIS